MSPELITAIISLSARYGIPAAVSVLNNLRAAVTIDDAIDALRNADVPMDVLIADAQNRKHATTENRETLGTVQAAVWEQTR